MKLVVKRSVFAEGKWLVILHEDVYKGVVFQGTILEVKAFVDLVKDGHINVSDME